MKAIGIKMVELQPMRASMALYYRCACYNNRRKDYCC